MFIEAYKKALGVLMKKPITLWGLSLMSSLILSLAWIFLGVIPAFAMVVGYLITCGMAKIYIDGLNGKEVSSEQLFAAFNKNFLRVAGGMAWMTLWILIWSMVPIAGPIIAIVKTYSYRFVPYILINNPEVSATQALKLSMKQTDGIKAQMFLADLCTGAAIFVAFLVLGLLAAIPYIGVIFGFSLFVLIIAVSALYGIFTGLYQAYFFVAKNTVPVKEAVVVE